MSVNRFVVWLIASLVVHLLGLSTRAGEGPVKPPELKVLERLIGKWDSEVILKPAEWTPKEIRTKGTLTREWVLNDRFVQEKGGGPENPALCMFTYDSEKKAYRFWLFDSTGGALEQTGQWDEVSKIMTWKGSVGNGITTGGPMRFVDDNTIEWQAVAKDATGKVYLRMEGKVRRTK